jgi:Arc/MetJ-type ribon-helix-helix transcriptional regulator
MPQTATLQITLDEDRAKLIQKLLETGLYSGENEVVQAGLSRLQDEDDVRERWLREVAVPAYERMLADPSLGIPLEDVERELAADMENMVKQR